MQPIERTLQIEHESEQPESWLPVSFLVCYQYFIQGICLSLSSTLILTYPTLPSYSVLSMFAATSLPFSFKFLLAPFLERYTDEVYGRRKSWIVAACFIMGFFVFLISFMTGQPYQYIVPILFFLLILFTAVQDINVDALCLKELKSPERMSFFQSVMQMAGDIVGGLFFMKLVSKEFARKVFGRDQGIMTPQVFLMGVGVAILAMNTLIHFGYREKVLKEETAVSQKSLLDIIREYRVFFNIKTGYCRLAMFLIVYSQGNRFFSAGYQYELIRGGFSKERLNEIDNIVLVPLLLVTYIVSNFNYKQNAWRNIACITSLRLAAAIIIFLWGPTNPFSVFGTVFVLNSLSTLSFLFDATLINTYPVVGLEGLYVTMLNSCRNLGSNSTMHLKVIQLVGWRTATMVGFGIQVGLLLGFYWMSEWVKRGELYQRVGQKPIQKPHNEPVLVEYTQAHGNYEL